MTILEAIVLGIFNRTASAQLQTVPTKHYDPGRCGFQPHYDPGRCGPVPMYRDSNRTGLECPINSKIHYRKYG